LPVALFAALVMTIACGGSEPAPEKPAEAPAANPPAAAPASSPRVFFVAPQDGAKVKSPVKLEFGIENYELAAVPKEAVTEPRPGMGHHHVGVDTDCLPPGTPIPKAAPWVHFGDGKSVIEMQLPPGPHKLTLQLGNDLHQTVDQLCSTISVTVEP
jgi:hypothetical protein